MIQIISHARAPHQIEGARMLLAGLKRHGVAAEVVPHTQWATSMTVACWGWRLGTKYREHGRNVLVMERGYVGDRFRWMSLGWNGLNGRATFPTIDDGGARWRKHFAGEMQPWRSPEPGTPIWLIGQVPGDAAVRDLDHEAWARGVARELAKHGRPVIYRPHPVALERGYRNQGLVIERDVGPLSDALGRAAWMVTQNSNTGVVAALAGVPVVACDVGSMAWGVAGHEPGIEPPTPSRERWAHRLAWCQWLPEEIAAGTALEAVRQAIPGLDLDIAA